MHVVIRHYEGSDKLIDELVDRRADIEQIIRGVDGFQAYYLVKTSNGGASISVFKNETGTAESTTRAAAYLKENLEGLAVSPPQLIEGEAVVDFR